MKPRARDARRSIMTRAAWTTAGTAVALLASPLVSRAYEAEVCNGFIRDGLRFNLAYEVDRCYTPAGSTEQASIDYAMAAWNRITGVADRFLAPVSSDESDCAIVQTDGDWEIALVSAHPELGARAGVMIWRPSPCLPPYGPTQDGRIMEADVLVQQALPNSTSDVLSTSLTERETLIHELGHVLGANHELDEPSVMCEKESGDTCGRLGIHSVTGATQTRTDVLLPDDVQFASTFHSAAGGSPDIAVSPWHWAPSGETARIYGASRRITTCRGARIDVRYSNGNVGKNAVPEASRVPMKIVFSADTLMTTADRTVLDFSFWGAQGFWASSTKPITIPANLPLGLYHVGVLADPGNVLAEQDEHNNSTRLGLEVSVQAVCP